MTITLPTVSVTAHTSVTVKGGETSLQKARQWVRFALPLPREYNLSLDALHLTHDGECFPLQLRRLADWPDGSVRWLDCQGLLPCSGDYALSTEGEAPSPTEKVSVISTDETVVLENSELSVTLSRVGSSPVTSVRFAGTERIGESAFVPSVTTVAGKNFTSSSETKRDIAVLESGPLRAVVMVTGEHRNADGERCLGYRLIFELVAGLPVLTVRHSFVHDDPGVETHHLSQIGISTDWQGSGESHFLHQNRYSNTSIPRDVTTAHPVDIRAAIDLPMEKVHNIEALEDDHDYPWFINPPLNDTLPWIGCALDNAAVVMQADDFSPLAPSGLRAEGTTLTFDAWPAWADPAEVRQGWSREAALRFVFSEGADHPGCAQIRCAIASVQDGAAALPQAWYVAADALMSRHLLPSGSDVSAWDRYLAKLTTLSTPAGMWDLGDTIDPGYSMTYAGVGRLKRIPITPRFNAGFHHALQEWSCNRIFEPVWTNNEYDVILAMVREIVRGGATPSLLQHTRWFARHAVEIDFISYSDHPELHHGSPAHSAGHCNASSYPSHLWTEGLLAWYCLSGDRDVLDAAIAMGDFIIDTFNDPARRGKLWNFTRELGWALMCTASLADITGEERFLTISQEISNLICSHPIDDALADAMVMYAFGYASLAMGVEALWQITGGKQESTWLVALADTLFRVPRPLHENALADSMVLNYCNAAYAVSGEKRHLEPGLPILEVIRESSSWASPELFTKPVAMLYRGLSRFVHYAHGDGLLT